MKDTKRIVALAVLAALFLVTASPALALFGKVGKEAMPVGAPIPQNQDVETYQGVPCRGKLTAVDNEGDGYTFALVEEPSKGSVELEGDTFVYTPEEKKTGKDSFTFSATDSEGNTSVPATVTVHIRRQKTDVQYSDMEGEPSHAAAVRLAEEGIFVGQRMAGAWFFEPDTAVSRSQFLAMAMEAAGIPVDHRTRLTGFWDDESIAAWAKGYASAAVREGIISGVTTERGICFNGDASITLGEAAAVMDRLLDVADVALEEEPVAAEAWAAQAVANMESVRVVPDGSGGGEKNPLTRGEAAEIIVSALELLERESGEKSLSGWLRRGA